MRRPGEALSVRFEGRKAGHRVAMRERACLAYLKRILERRGEIPPATVVTRVLVPLRRR